MSYKQLHRCPEVTPHKFYIFKLRSPSDTRQTRPAVADKTSESVACSGRSSRMETAKEGTAKGSEQDRRNGTSASEGWD